MAEKLRIEINKTKYKDETRPAWWWSSCGSNNDAAIGLIHCANNFMTRDEAIAHATQFWARYGVEIEVLEA